MDAVTLRLVSGSFDLYEYLRPALAVLRPYMNQEDLEGEGGFELVTLALEGQEKYMTQFGILERAMEEPSQPFVMPYDVRAFQRWHRYLVEISDPARADEFQNLSWVNLELPDGPLLSSNHRFPAPLTNVASFDEHIQNRLKLLWRPVPPPSLPTHDDSITSSDSDGQASEKAIKERKVDRKKCSRQICSQPVGSPTPCVPQVERNISLKGNSILSTLKDSTAMIAQDDAVQSAPFLICTRSMSNKRQRQVDQDEVTDSAPLTKSTRTSSKHTNEAEEQTDTPAHPNRAAKKRRARTPEAMVATSSKDQNQHISAQSNTRANIQERMLSLWDATPASFRSSKPPSLISSRQLARLRKGLPANVLTPCLQCIFHGCEDQCEGVPMQACAPCKKRRQGTCGLVASPDLRGQYNSRAWKVGQCSLEKLQLILASVELFADTAIINAELANSSLQRARQDLGKFCCLVSEMYRCGDC